MIVLPNIIRETVTSQLPGRENGPADAYRHLLIAAETTRRFGEDVARDLLVWHEDRGDEGGARPDERAMDEHNNEIGIAIGRQARTWDDVVAASQRALEGSAPDGSGTVAATDFPHASGAKWLSTDRWRKNPVYEFDRTREMPTAETNWHTNPDRSDGIDWVGGAVPVKKPRPYRLGGEAFRFPSYRFEEDRKQRQEATRTRPDLSRWRLRDDAPAANGPARSPHMPNDLFDPVNAPEAEMRRVMKSDAYWTAGHPDHAAAQQTVKAWHDRRYGTAPAALDAAGRMLPETEPHSAAIRGALPGLFTNADIPQKATPAQENAQALDLLLRFARTALRSGDASGLPGAVDRGLGDLFPATPPGRPAPWRQAVQDTINDLSRNDAAAEPLRDDGNIGPRTVAAFGRTLTGAGPDRFVRRLAQNLGFA